MKKRFCDIPTCGKEFPAAISSDFFERYPMALKIETFKRLPDGTHQRIDVCWDCIIQALTERDTLKSMGGPPSTHP